MSWHTVGSENLSLELDGTSKNVLGGHRATSKNKVLLCVYFEMCMWSEREPVPEGDRW